MGYRERSDSDFDSNAFADQFAPDDDFLDAENSTIFTRIGSDNGWALSTDDDGSNQGTIEVIYGSYPTNSVPGDGYGIGSGTATTRSSRTNDEDEHAEQQRLARARNNIHQISNRSASPHETSDDSGRFNDQNQRALAEAIRRIRRKGAGTDGRNVSIQINSGVIDKSVETRPIPPTEFSGCEFEATLHRMQLAPSGEWIVQFRVKFEDRQQVHELDGTAQMALKIKVEQI